MIKNEVEIAKMYLNTILEGNALDAECKAIKGKIQPSGTFDNEEDLNTAIALHSKIAEFQGRLKCLEEILGINSTILPTEGHKAPSHT